MSPPFHPLATRQIQPFSDAAEGARMPDHEHERYHRTGFQVGPFGRGGGAAPR